MFHGRWVYLLHDHFISLRVEILVHKISLTPPLFIEVPVWSQESRLLCAKGIDCASVSISIRFWICSDSVVFVCIYFYFITVILYLFCHLNIIAHTLPMNWLVFNTNFDSCIIKSFRSNTQSTVTSAYDYIALCFF